MLSEKQIYEAKVFLRSYKDAINCIEQTIIKKVAFEHYQVKYSEIQTEVEKEEALKLFKFSRYWLWREFLTQFFTPEASNLEEFQKQMSEAKKNS